MRTLRTSSDRGHAKHGWLESYHTFSFSDYFDPAHMGFRSLRVINEDVVAPGTGFGMHGHRDMEIITYVLEGELQHEDSLGHKQVLRPGELQRMTAGSGIRHSEVNPSRQTPVHLYQIWIKPDTQGLTPEYDQQTLTPGDRAQKWQLVASPKGELGLMHIHQDARLWLSTLDAGTSLNKAIEPARHYWLQVLRGTAALDGQTLSAGDALAFQNESELNVTASTASELLLFDLA